MYLIKKNSASISDYVDWRSLRFSRTLSSDVDVLQFDLIFTEATFSKVVYADEIELEDGSGNNVFAGTVVNAPILYMSNGQLKQSVEVVDYSHQLVRSAITNNDDYGDVNHLYIINSVVGSYVNRKTKSLMIWRVGGLLDHTQQQ